MPNLALKPLSLTIATTVMLACTSAVTESENIDSDAIWAGISIVSVDGQGSTINVELNVGGRNGTNLSLSQGDSVVAVTSEGNVTLERDEDVFDVDYEGELPVGESDELIRVNFMRSGAADVTGSRVNIPRAFRISFPQNNMTFDNLEDIEILWNTGLSGDNVKLHQTATCKNSQNQDVTVTETIDVADNGRYNSDFLSREVRGLINARGCDYSLSIDRTRNGTLASGFGEGGFIRATQTRATTGIRVVI